MSTDKKIKTILVIGNGFDIAHGLKTRYTDFLDFIEDKRREDIEHFVNRTLQKSSINLKNISESALEKRKKGIRDFYKQNGIEHRKKVKQKRLMSHIYRSLKSRLFLKPRIFEYIFTFGNVWIDYFKVIRENKKHRISEDWIDFEKELEDIIQKIESLIREGDSAKEKINKDHNLSLILGNYILAPVKIIVQEIIPKLEWDLKILLLALESYLLNEEDKLQHRQLELIKNLPEVSFVISYNYTNTWQKIYGQNSPNVNPYFIHGQLGKHNLVLGIGETLSHELENIHTECASFKKFFQRIKYRLGNDYKKISKNYYQYYKWQIVIYGHSLDSTDADSLHWLMGQEEKFDTELDKVIIYYYDEKSYNRQIANAIQIIGKKALMSAVHSGKLVFLPVKD